MNSGEPPLLDSEQLEALKAIAEDSGPDTLEELLQLFEEDNRPLLEQMQTALDQGDLPKLSKLAHAMAGTCGNMAANRLALHCRDLEHRANEGDGDTARELLASVQADFQKSVEALREELSSV